MDWAIVVAAGRGERMGLTINKVYAPLAGQCALAWSVDALLPHVDGVVVVIGAADEGAWDALRQKKQWPERVRAVLGGDTRQASVSKGLAALPEGAVFVAIHDAARPLLTGALIRRCLESAHAHGSGVAALPVTDTIATIGANGMYEASLDRASLAAMQTPQAFRKDWLQEAYALAQAQGAMATDDASLIRCAGYPVRLVQGEAVNQKLTTKADLIFLEAMLKNEAAERGPRTGFGYDAHRLVEGRPLVLCGVQIPYEKGLDGHSDADVAVHALMDALMGAAAMGDIGRMFPDSDPAYLGISSLIILARVGQQLEQAGWRVAHADVTMVAQRPKLAPFMDQMRANLAQTLGIPEDCVNVKATTTERMGFEGRGEGISSMAVATLA